MANDRETSDYPKRLLGRMLAEAAKARADKEAASSQPSNEEVLKLYEQLSNPALSAAEKAEAMSTLMESPAAYERWLTLTRFMHMHSGEASAVRSENQLPQVRRQYDGKVQEGFGQKLQRLLTNFWYNPALSAAFGLALGVLVTSLYVGTPISGNRGETDPVYPQQGVPLPSKASQYSVAAGTAPAVTDALHLGKTIRCINATKVTIRLCYSATSPDQQWFQIKEADQVKALAPPVNTDRIVSTSLKADMLLLEHERAGEYRISLLRITEAPQGVQMALLHEESAGTGYFDDVHLDEKGLSYMFHEGSNVTPRRFSIQ